MSTGLNETAEAINLAPLIDHTLLRPNATSEDVDRLCEEAHTHGFAAVCVNGIWVDRAAMRLQGSTVRVASVVGFPLGASTSVAKGFEAKDAVQNGAMEIDTVLALGKVKSGDWEGVRRELAMLREAVPSACLKLILETCLLTDEEKRRVCGLAVEARFEFVKTSTGFSRSGATLDDVRLMRDAVGKSLGVKASGGIRTRQEALAMIRAGATRLGLSTSLSIL